MMRAGWASTAPRRKAVRSRVFARVGVRIGVLLASIMLVQPAVARPLDGHSACLLVSRPRPGNALAHSDTLQAFGSFDTLPLLRCFALGNKARGLSGGEGYDTMRAYLEHCYYMDDAVGCFGYADADNDLRPGDGSRYTEYREWLKSVLYLRVDSSWYCRDVESIIGSFHYYPGHGLYPNGAIAIERYIVGSNKCDSAKWSREIEAEFAGIYSEWRDTVKDSLHEARPDTTIPSIDDIGLSILRGPKQAVPPSALPPGADHLALLRMSEDPFERSTELIFTVADYGLVTFELFDILGHRVRSNGIGQVLDPGEHRITITGDGLASGVYFARLTYHDGDVHSIMVRKR